MKQWDDARLFVDRRNVNWVNTIILFTIITAVTVVATFGPDPARLAIRFFWWALTGLFVGLILNYIFWDKIAIHLSSSTLAKIWRIVGRTVTTEKARAFQHRIRRMLNIYGSELGAVPSGTRSSRARSRVAGDRIESYLQRSAPIRMALR